MRSRISAAALRVNVMARMLAGSTPAHSRLIYRVTRTCVLPVPAEASSTTLRAGSMAHARAAWSRVIITSTGDGGSSNGSRRSVAIHVVLSAHGGVLAVPAETPRGGPRRKLAPLDPVDRVDQPFLPVGKLPRRVGAVVDHHPDRLALAKGDVAGLAHLPARTARALQLLLGTDRVDRQLDRLGRLGRASVLVVDQPKAAVLQQVDPVGLPAQPDRAGDAVRRHGELAVERVLEQSFAHRRGACLLYTSDD